MKRITLWILLGLALGVGAVAGLDQSIRNQIVLYHPDPSLPTPAGSRRSGDDVGRCEYQR